jgi:peptidoglycan hydrolase CwlO-like protein
VLVNQFDVQQQEAGSVISEIRQHFTYLQQQLQGYQENSPVSKEEIEGLQKEIREFESFFD